MHDDTDLLVIGSGVAGAYAALSALRAGARVTLLTKGALSSGSTRWAQGGVAAPRDPADREPHAHDTLRAGRGLCEPQAVAAFVAEAQAHVDGLGEYGVTFAPALTLEGGHSAPRIRYADDATGAEISRALCGALRAQEARSGGRLQLVERAFVTELVQSGPGERVTGARWEQGGGRGTGVTRARAVLLATGGYGRLFPVTTAPPEGTGDGLVLAYRAGATLRDLEFVQFHPTAVVGPGGTQLVTEAVRGEGGWLVNAAGERFMERYDPLLELAPRDVVARAIAAERRRTGAAFLDLRPRGEAFARARFPTVYAALLTQGLHLGRDLVPVQPAAHYSVGGVLTDLWGRTEVPGLYAAGEVASSGLHGANRLASNSLSEGLVFGARAARAALEEAPAPSAPAPARSAPGWPVLSPGTFPTALDPACGPAVRAIVGDAAGLLRGTDELRAALGQLGALLPGPDAPATPQADPLTTLPPEQRGAAREAAHLLLLGRLLLRAALAREESRGCHARPDCPKTDPDARHSLQRRDDPAVRWSAPVPPAPALPRAPVPPFSGDSRC
ncbi:L-aspartate oxidase [Deinococcus wulumuqiensis]